MSAVQGVNLLSAARLQARRRRQRVARWTGVVGVYALLLLAGWGAVRVGWSGPAQSVASSLDATQQRIQQSQQSLQTLQPRLAEAQTTFAASRAIGDQPDWSLLLTLLADLLDEHTVLASCHLEPISERELSVPGARDASATANAQQAAHGPYRLELKGYSQTQSAVTAYALRLERTELFEDVSVRDTNTEPFRDENAVSFRIICRLGQAPVASSPDDAALNRAGDRAGGG